MGQNTCEEIAVWFLAVRAHTGVDIFTKRLADGLEKKGIRAEITWLPHRAEYLPWTVPIPTPPKWATIVHVNSWLHWRFLPKKLPIVTTIHHSVQDAAFLPYKSLLQRLYHKFWITPLELKSIQKSSVVTAVSNYTAQCIEKYFNISDVEVIYNGIDVKMFHPQPLKKIVLKEPFKLLFVGSSSKRKGFDLLPEIMKGLGDGYKLYYTSEAPKYYKLPANMEQLPPLKTTEELVHIYNVMDALIFPSRLEGFGLVVAEAMACGLPVVVASNSALPEIVEHGISGLLCRADEASSFISTVKNITNDQKLYGEIAHLGHIRIQDNFSLTKMINNYLDVYQRVLRVSNSTK